MSQKQYWKKNRKTINPTVQQCANQLKTEFREEIAATLKIKNKDEVKNANKNIVETLNDKLKQRDDI